ncbi:DNA-binding response regulator [Paenibacillus montanisoli]|uniref:DNA-binding response regulator n=2 Tax=Paenibacillus montanisoli TaxID=2081970 RepID=A0A328UCD6_9BACL|nr:DNA-binding response regulator [Paenibacillus montanisoli]
MEEATYNLLVVDDEEIAIRGIEHGIDWSTLPVANIFTAYDAEEARQVFKDHKVHVLISDIDMPKENGIQLLAWVNEHSPETETIILTGHADFIFAQQAVQLDSFDYLLKPIDHDVLKGSVEKAINTIAERERDDSFRKTYEYYYDQWNRQLPLLVERFWQDVLNQRIQTSAPQLAPMYSLYDIQLDADKKVLPVLISVEEWKKDWSTHDEEIMTYALKNAAAEMLLKDRAGHIIQDTNGMLFALLYSPDEGQEELLAGLAAEYVDKCAQYLYAVVSCYIGEAVHVPSLRACVQQLAEMERSTLGQTGSVFRLNPPMQPGNSPARHNANKQHGRFAAPVPNYQEWSTLVEQGKASELQLRIEELFDRLSASQIDHAYIVNYYFSVVHMIFQLFQRRTVSAHELYKGEEWKAGESAMKSLSAMKGWTIRFIGTAAEFLGAQEKEVSHTIARVQQYINANLHQEMSREDIAEHVYLNPAYLSRLFRKETGLSLTDYTASLRIQKAKLELSDTNHRVCDVALSVGYSNFSHFTKLFKKTTGLTPQEYRKKHQRILE